MATSTTLLAAAITARAATSQPSPGGEGDRRQGGQVDGEGQPQAAPAAQAGGQRPAHRQADQGPALQAPVRHVQAALLRGQRAPGALALLEVLRELAPSG